MQAVIVAGGKGSRLLGHTGGIPKPLVTVGGRPLIDHQLQLAKQHGFDDIVLLLGCQAGEIKSFVADGSRWGVKVRTVEESNPLGTAGAVLASLDVLAPRFLVLYGDTLANVDLTRFWNAHSTRNADATLFLHPNSHPADSDLVDVDSQNRITAIFPYPHDPERDYRNLVNAALYVLQRESLAVFASDERPLDFGKHLFPRMLSGGLKLFGYPSPEYIKDAGTPDRLESVRADYASGKWRRGSLESPTPAVFLDRDGTINEEVERVSHPEGFRLLEGAASGIRELNRAGWRVIVITNQAVIARGECSEATLRAIHNRMETQLGRQGAYVDGIYHCPHHPDRGFPGERIDLKWACTCRKPGTGLIDLARLEFNLDLSRSWFIGDTTTDICTARRAGIRPILVQTGHGGRDAKYPDSPDFIAADLDAAARLILRNSGEQ